MPATWNTHLTYVLVWSWPLAIAAVSAVYGCKFASAFPPFRALICIFLSSVFTVRAFMKRRKQFKDFVSSTGMVTFNRYWRLVILATVDFTITIPLATWAIVQNASTHVYPWVSWADTHWGYSRIFQVPVEVLRQDQIVTFELYRWTCVLCALAFFAFFGFADEARKNYRLFASTVTKRFGFTTFTESTAISNSYANSSLHFASEHALIKPLYSMVKSGTSSKGGVSLPVFVTQQIESKRDSFDSSSDKLSTSITIGEYDLKVQPYTPTEQSNSSSSSSMISVVDDIPQVPESVLDPASVRRPSVPDAPKSVHPDDPFYQV